MHTQAKDTPAAGAARRLIVNADDFGRSRGINAAVIRAHREGVLTTASLMVNEAACDEAVALARENPRLGVGLHLTLVCGRSALPAEKIPGLVNGEGKFGDCPAWLLVYARFMPAVVTKSTSPLIVTFGAGP